MRIIWKDVVGYEGLYKVSNTGLILGLKSNTYLKPRNSNLGYPRICLYKNRKKHYLSIHRLVAIAFLSNLNNYPEVNHKDGNKENNKVENLEWTTSSENIKHAFKLKLRIPLKGEDCPNSKLTEKQVKEIYSLAHNSNLTQKQIGQKYNIRQTTVLKIKKKQRWKHILNEI